MHVIQCQVGFQVKDKRPIIGCFNSLKCLLNCSPRGNQLGLKYLCLLAQSLGLYTETAKFHPIWFPVLFPGFICNGGTQTEQPYGVWELHIWIEYLLCATFTADLRFKVKGRTSSKFCQTYHHVVLKVTLLIFRMEFLMLSITPLPAQICLAAAFTLEPIVILLLQLYFVMYYFVNVLLLL